MKEFNLSKKIVSFHEEEAVTTRNIKEFIKRQLDRIDIPTIHSTGDPEKDLLKWRIWLKEEMKKDAGDKLI